MSKVIIGIHGLGNKPPAVLLQKWWKASISEGLAMINRPRQSYRFELVYWAGYLHKNPLQISETDPENPLFLEDPYIPSGQVSIKETNNNKRKLLEYLEKQFDKSDAQ